MIHSLQAVDREVLLAHCFGGHAVLPTVWAMRWMADAAEQVFVGSQYLGLANYRLLNGVVCNGQEASQFRVCATPVSSGQETALPSSAGHWCHVVVESEVRGRTVAHYCADVLVSAGEAAGTALPVGEPITTPPDNALLHWNPYQDGTLFHGAPLQMIEQVMALNEAGLLVRCRAPSTAQWQVDDAVLQALLVWARGHYQAASLPTAVGAWRQHGPVPKQTPFLIALTVRKHSTRRLLADLRVLDALGNVYAEVSSAEATISKSLNQKFLDNRASLGEGYRL